MNFRNIFWGLFIAAALPITYFIGSEVFWAMHISPDDDLTLDKLQARYHGELSSKEIYNRGESYTVVRGPLPPAYVLALPSSPPSYIFDSSGKLVDWRADPGDLPQNDSYFDWFNDTN